jgi:hypothetical protein
MPLNGPIEIRCRCRFDRFCRIYRQKIRIPNLSTRRVHPLPHILHHTTLLVRTCTYEPLNPPAGSNLLNII